jgi:hypothetical protein
MSQPVDQVRLVKAWTTTPFDERPQPSPAHQNPTPKEEK